MSEKSRAQPETAPVGLFRLTAAEWRLLLRPRLLAMVCASALTGALLAPGVQQAAPVLWASLAVGLLGIAGTLLNQVQERHLDARMERTRDRPLATGRVTPAPALLLAVLALLAGVSLLLPSPAALGLGLLALLLYNGIYTPLKPKTAFAILPGALCGALPPLIGWLVAGGSLEQGGILLLAALLAIWQIPHFLLLSLRCRQDYRRAGLPVLADRLDAAGMRRVVAAWVLAATVGTAILAGFGPVRGALVRALLPVLGSWLLYGLWRQIRRGELRPLFVRVNMFMALVLACLLADRLFG
ncbi:protoheme IX farnesyltransferase [Geothermobacter ehrlichii]|uniref:Protoheme IX farnesyltransferase n=1 Tax=Geothermobacter ehrlichii TaxID=213224 RepID=A0A5D3WL42_9BACT|nr:UbiA family prenyltransferase [Geothermobacter ehrlichii]TYO98975.1 protoheme IX farnesyltransferase [Geothermobacter ehrlichii]